MSKGNHKQNIKAKRRPRTTITIKRVKRVLEPRVPEDIDLKKLSDLYRLEGMQTGIMLTTMLPQKLIDQVAIGDVPKKVETIKLLEMIKKGLEAAHRAALDKLESLEVAVESLVGYVPLDQDDLTQSDIFIRLIAIPEEEGGGVCAELDPGCRGAGETPGKALEDISTMIDEYLSGKRISTRLGERNDAS